MTINAKEIRSISDQAQATYQEKCLKKAAPVLEKAEKDVRQAAEKGEYHLVLTYKDEDVRNGVELSFAGAGFRVENGFLTDPKNADKTQYTVKVAW